MAAFKDSITPEIRAFMEKQKMYFVATAAKDGRINLSPKGLESFRILDNSTVAYLDLTGSGNETSAHIEADGRMTIMMCSFDEKPMILRLYGRGEVIRPRHPRFAEMSLMFPKTPGTRQVIVLHVQSLQTSCGWGVPMYEYKGNHSLLPDWATKKGDDEIRDYWAKKNSTSIDGLPTKLLVD